VEKLPASPLTTTGWALVAVTRNSLGRYSATSKLTPYSGGSFRSLSTGRNTTCQSPSAALAGTCTRVARLPNSLLSTRRSRTVSPLGETSFSWKAPFTTCCPDAVFGSVLDGSTVRRTIPLTQTSSPGR
jgi:hypothetical protein